MLRKIKNAQFNLLDYIIDTQHKTQDNIKKGTVKYLLIISCFQSKHSSFVSLKVRESLTPFGRLGRSLCQSHLNLNVYKAVVTGSYNVMNKYSPIFLIAKYVLKT